MPELMELALELLRRAAEMRGQGQTAEADSLSAEGLTLVEKNAGSHSPTAARHLIWLAASREAQGDYEGARVTAERAVALLEAVGNTLLEAPPLASACKRGAASGTFTVILPAMLRPKPFYKPRSNTPLRNWATPMTKLPPPATIWASFTNIPASSTKPSNSTAQRFPT